ncbi:adenosylcobinamide-GDP ribazoletransferase [Halomonas heilongjiangensis]|uniref:Adenosylcobinamide-GDP ribazoletransferase n=1 Tax=Halomonas heilongjiangensis TaxID=1387883 RepID=A0A2N7TT21_9GAMM|nr:adenosylcobinamide-GDP ribazoletransferase [Halomonas heilongjiangensis]PMR71342.1 adenosylcobinamide-GDP ribazoletransferase [Halomonas heilongjiangensis]PXX88613.1 adenosylcobinamide-GDP ribazoletransferase [Halomonas heilongjiangensis]
MREAGYGLLLAIQFLTRLPVPVESPWTAATSRWAVRCYPLVGLLLGAVLAGVYLLLQERLPTPLLALVLLSLWVALSGGLHLDGLMDVADALGSNAPLEKRWAIMKDPQVGSFAILALLFLLAWKAMLLWALLEARVSPVLLALVPALGRLGAVALLVLAPAARSEGLAWHWKQHLDRRDLLLALVPPALLLGWLPGWPLLLVALPVFLLTYGAAMIRAFKGINGDIVGAAIEGGELWLLLIAWSWWSFATG